LKPNGTKLLNAALVYADLGYRVFPCRKGEKIPATAHGFKDATTDPDQIEAWWSTWPMANIGLETAGLLVVDVDGAENEWPGDELAASLADCPTSQTPRGGRHYLYRQPGGKDWKNTTSKLSPSVDTRAEGGYIVVAPSVVGGNAYKWIEPLDDPIENLKEPPAWLIQKLDTMGQAKVPHGGAGGNAIPEGQRNSTLASLAGNMRRAGMTEAEILAAITTANSERCNPPLPDIEVSQIAKSIARNEPDQIATALAEGHWDQMASVLVGEQAEQVVKDPGPIPADLLYVPGFIADVMEVSLSTAPYPNRAMAFCGAVAIQALLGARRVRTVGNVRTNIYILGLANSGSGKDWPRKVNRAIAQEIGWGDSISDRFASGEGIEDALVLNPAILFQTDEIDGMLQSINKSKDARHESIIQTVLTMHSSADSQFTTRRKAGQEKSATIDQPWLGIFGTAIPKHYYEALSERMISNGFFARMIIVESAPRGRGVEAKPIELPGKVTTVASWWARQYADSGNLANHHPQAAIIPQTKEATAALNQNQAEVDQEYHKADKANDPVAASVWARANETARKLALLYAISENHERPKIDEKAAQWASAFAMHQARRMLYMASAYVADSTHEQMSLRLKQLLRNAPEQTMSRSRLLRKMKIDARQFNLLIETQISSGTLEIGSRFFSRKPSVVYRLVESAE